MTNYEERYLQSYAKLCDIILGINTAKAWDIACNPDCPECGYEMELKRGELRCGNMECATNADDTDRFDWTEA